MGRGRRLPLTIALFILNLRRTAERAGRAAERLETLERNDATHRQMLDAAPPHPEQRGPLLPRNAQPAARFRPMRQHDLLPLPHDGPGPTITSKR